MKRPFQTGKVTISRKQGLTDREEKMQCHQSSEDQKQASEQREALANATKRGAMTKRRL